jgi:hypothetical protein
MNSPVKRPTRPIFRRVNPQRQLKREPVRKRVDFRHLPPYPRKPPNCLREDQPVTVCIALGCDISEAAGSPPKLILVTDQMVSTVVSSAEISSKIRFLSPGWYVMFAGNDVTSVDVIIGKTKALLADIPEPKSGRLIAKLREAYQSTRRTRINDSILSSYNWDIDKFMTDGRRLLGPSEFSSRLYQIEQFSLDCSFLVAGFHSDTATHPTLFRIDNPGVLTAEVLTGYAAIGTGATRALAYLDWRHQSWRLSLQESVYNAIAAKSLAESALGVGPGTSAMIFERGQPRARSLNNEEISAIKRLWENEEACLRPANLKDRVGEILGL